MKKAPADIKAIFADALEKGTDEERKAYLDRACESNTALRQKVEALLKAYTKSGNVPDTPIVSSDLMPEETALAEGPGTTIDRYKLLEKIGEGGMAVVYMAQQERPLRRKVALKIIKLGMDTKQVIARFEAERQALALMDHPNIAKVLDAGATDTGRPYFVMELVQGVSITEYCDQNSLSTAERLGLFMRVCNAVQHAHQKGIIHRDIKPTNVMVTHHDGKPIPKVIDFGIAKATNQRLTEKTLFTRYAHIIGTPAYMSPEQAELSDVDIDTRSDIYSLGVLLYELLTGQTPFGEEELRSAGYVEMQRIIREEEPTKPSTKLSTLGATLTQIAQHRQVTPDALRRLIQGDMDWIVMKSLEKDRTRRYDTANALAQDIQRHLANEPVLARSPKIAYRLHKFLRRHRMQVAAVLVLIVLIGVLVMTFATRKQFSAAKSLLDEKTLSQAKEAFVRGDYAVALKRAESLADSKDLGPQARLLCANILVDWGEPNEAIRMLEDLLQEDPEIAGVAHLLMARVILETEFSDSDWVKRVEEHRQRAEELLPKSADTYFQRAMTAVSIKEKLEFLNEALRLDRGHYESLRLRAYTFRASKNYKEMKKDAYGMTMKKKDDPLGYSLHALALRELDAYEDAIEEYDHAIGLSYEDPQSVRLYEQLCETYLRTEKYQDAIVKAEEGLRRFPNESILQFRLFCALTDAGDYEKASAVFRQVAAASLSSRRQFEDRSMKHVFNRLAAGRFWYLPDSKPDGLAFLAMWEAEEIYSKLKKKAERLICDGFHPNCSPDGTKVAFSLGIQGYSGIAVFDRASQETELLIVPGKQPKWSPDGSYLAFVREHRHLRLSEVTAAEHKYHHHATYRKEIWIIRPDGTGARRLANGVWPAWSSDSRHVYFQLGKRYSIPIEGGEARPKPVLDGFTSIHTVSPDNKYVAYVEVGSFKILDLASQSPAWQFAVSNRDIGYARAWSPKSRQFCMGGRNNPESRTGLWICDLDAEQLVRVLDGPILGGSWPHDETALAFSLGQPFYEIWSAAIDPNISTIEALGPGLTFEEYYQEMVDYYTHKIELEPENSQGYLKRARFYLLNGQKEKARADTDQYKTLLKPQSTPINLGVPVNSLYSDYGSFISADSLSLYFISGRPDGSRSRSGDIWVATRETPQDPWVEPVNLGPTVNSPDEECGVCLSGNGLELCFASDRPGGLGGRDLWITTRASVSAPWGEPVNLGSLINDAANDDNPCFTADGLSLIFNSGRSDGYGVADLWVSTRSTLSDSWSEPVNLGPTVNGPYNDLMPALSPDSLSLFFTSNRPGGLGRDDLWLTTRATIHDPWKVPVNLGPRINSPLNEFSPCVSSDGSTLYFSSNDFSAGIGAFGVLDMWQVPITSVLASVQTNGDVETIQNQLGSDNGKED